MLAVSLSRGVGPMTKREYAGPSLDLSWQTPPWARDDEDAQASDSDDNSGDESNPEPDQTNMTDTTPADPDSEQTQTTIGADKNGKTVSVTSPDNFGEIKTECWPSHIDPSEVKSNRRRQIIQTAAMHRNWTQVQIARYVGSSSGYVSETLKEHWPDHPSRNSDAAPSVPDDQIPSISTGEADDIRERLLNGESGSRLAEEYDVSAHTISKVARGGGCYADGPSHPPVRYDASAREYTIIGDSSETSGDSRDRGRESTGQPSDETSDGSSEQWPTKLALTEDEVDEVRARLVFGESASALAEDYNTSTRTIHNAAMGKNSYPRVTSHPPISYDTSNEYWVIDDDSDGSGGEFGPESIDTGARDKTRQDSTPTETPPNPESRVAMATTAAEAIRATSGSGETQRAMEHLINILSDGGDSE